MDADIVIVGAGPAGVSAAWPIARAGRRVLILDAGQGTCRRPDAERPPLAQSRASPEGWRHLLGDDLSALRDVGFASPKLRTAAPPGFGEDFAGANRLRTAGFRAVGALAPGGLSNIWGAVACAYNAADMAGWPVGEAEMAPSFRAVAERIGLSGSGDDDLAGFQGAGLPLQPSLPLGGAVAQVMARYRTCRTGGLVLGRARNAVLSRPHGDRGECRLTKACMWGCHRRAIYNASDDIQSLARLDNVRVDGGVLVESVARRPDGTWQVLGRRNGGAVSYAAPRVALAAGALASTRLGLAALGHVGRSRRLFTSPAFAFALLLPSRLGMPLDPEGFGMAQAALHLPLSPFPGDGLFGLLYEADGFTVSDMIAGMPLTRRGAAMVMGALMPGLVVGLAYFPGVYSANSVCLDADGVLDVRGGVAEGFDDALRRGARRLAGDFRRLGAWMLPGSVKSFAPGTEVHYAGPLAMGEVSDVNGEIIGAPGLFAIDGAALPGVSAKHHTFTLMANADRIGRHLARE